ncbi:MAG: ribosome maturation factor RimP [Candidatus Binatia bacterium]
MAGDATIARVWEIAAPVAEGEGMEVVDIELRREGRGAGRVLRVYLDREGGPSLADLTRVSHQLSDLLDVHDVVAGAYTLEVSSPGVNRLLKKPGDFVRFIGKRVRVRAREIVDGRRSFLGMLREVKEDGIMLSQDNREFHIPFSLIEKANYEHDWSAGICSKT